jgi:choline transport protein
MTGAVIIIITCLTCASPNFQSAEFVFTRYINDVGWNNGVAWILGLLQSRSYRYMVKGGSANIRFLRIDRLRCRLSHGRGNAQSPPERSQDNGRCRPHRCFLIFHLPHLLAVQYAGCRPCQFQPRRSPLGDNVSSHLKSCRCRLSSGKSYHFPKVVADNQVIPIVAMAFTAQAIMTASSRMSYAFARDRGLPFSRYFAMMHKSGVPINAVLLSTVCVIVFGCIYLGSSSALNAILSSSVVFLNISYSIPSRSIPSRLVDCR